MLRARAVLFVVALALLAFEMAQIRAFSYAMDPRLVYGAIGLAMLGLGAAAVAVALRPSLADEARVPTWCVSFGASMALAMALFARVSTLFDAGNIGSFLVLGAPLLLLSGLPYAFGGLATVSLLVRGEDVHGRYAANLVGSAIGCFAVQPFLRSVGLEKILILVALLPVVAAVAMGLRKVGLAIAAALLVALPFADRVFPFKPDPHDLYAIGERNVARLGLPAPNRELARWDPVARVEVFQFPGALGTINDRAPLKLLVHDGGAGSLLMAVEGYPDLRRALYEGTTYGAAYAVVDRPDRVLAIGLGGAPDILTAEYFGAKRIVGVEVNASTLEAVRTKFAGFLGDPYGKPGVELHALDGRSFVESTRDTFDVVQISGTDTYSAGAAGAFMFSESYLYTEEAIAAFLRVLADDGVLTMIRFGPEPLRLVATEVSAARKLGIPHPEKHFVILGQGSCQSVVFSKKEIDLAQIRRVAARITTARTLPTLNVPLNMAIGLANQPTLPPLAVVYVPGFASPDPAAQYLRAVGAGTEAGMLEAMPFDYTPVSDDRPFFFQFLGPKQLGRVLDAPADDFFASAFKSHLVMLGALAVLSALVLFAPLAMAKKSLEGARPTLVYFGAIGVAFLLVEVALIQRFTLLLGHPTWSVAATICALLAASALGSRIAGSSTRGDERTIAIAAVCVAVALIAMAVVPASAIRAVLRLPFAVRVVVLALAIAPLGAAMGAFFPTGLRIVARKSEALSAWGQGANAFASVVVSLAAPVCAMLVGFRAAFFAAIVLYALAAFTAPRLAR